MIVLHQGRSAAAVACSAMALLASVWLAAPLAAAHDECVPQAVWDDVPKVVAIGDAHGAYITVLSLLIKLGLVDDSLAWSGGETHLVFLGDLVDRGVRERDLLDLVRRIQVEAAQAGGRVHVILGNHESMNLISDFRYVPKAGFKAFEDLEQPGDRQEAWKEFQHSMRGSALSTEQLRSFFDANHPPGYFGRGRAFGPGGEYGYWLLEQAAALKINGVVFIHGGLTEKLGGLGLCEINRQVIDDLAAFQRLRAAFEEEHGIHRFASFTEVMSAAAAMEAYPSSGRSQKVHDAAAGLRAFLDSIVILPDGPLWYRGSSLEDERIERDRFEQSLELLSATAAVVGHTGTASGTIQSRFGGTLYRTDTGMFHAGRPQALVLEEGEVRVFDSRSESWVAALVEPPQGEGQWEDYTALGDLYLERHLKKAKIVSSRPLGRGGTRPLLVELNDADMAIRGLFKNVDRTIVVKRPDGSKYTTEDRHQHEVAAYRVDRMLGLGMVPVTVPRELASHGEGSIQLWIEGATDQSAFDPATADAAYAERLPLLQQRAKVFDVLIGNMTRKATDVLHQPEQGRLYLVDHSTAFSVLGTAEVFFPKQGCVLDPEMEGAVRLLSREELHKQLKPWLSKEQIRAILTRRDGLLAGCTRPAAEQAAM